VSAFALTTIDSKSDRWPSVSGSMRHRRRDQLPNVRVPTTFLWGERDAFMTPEEGGVAARLVPVGRFEVISGAGHLPSTDQPEATAALLEAALGAR
jgi:pimeloyl-ACP methyl ester carboxylesterase